MQKKKLSIAIYAAHLSIASTGIFLVLLAVLHIIKPELSPSWRLISEYEIGNAGWLMQFAFLALALGSMSLLVAIWPEIRTIGGYIGLALLLIVTAGLVLAGIFISDPVTVSKDAWSTHGALHAWGAVLVIPTAPLFATCISWVLSRSSLIRVSSRCFLWLTTLTVWLSFAAFVLSGGTRVDGTQRPGDWYGWPNRAFIVALSVWMIIVAWNVIKIYQYQAKAQKTHAIEKAWSGKPR